MADPVKTGVLSSLPRENPYPVIVCSGGGEVDFFNPAAEQLAAALGFDKVSDLLPDAHADLVAAGLQGSPSLSARVDVGGRTIVWAYRAVPEFNTVNLYGLEQDGSTGSASLASSLPRVNPNPVISCDRHGRIRFSNPAARYLMQALRLESEAALLPLSHMRLVGSCADAAESVSVRTALEGRSFEWTYRRDADSGSINIYGHEITEHVQAESTFLAALDNLPTGVVVVDADLRVRAINRSAQEILATSGGLTIDQGRLSAPAPEGLPGTTPRVMVRLHGLVAGALAERRYQHASGEVMIVPRGAGHTPLELLVAPLENRKGSQAPLALIFLCNPEPSTGGAQDILRSLYNLTPTEANIASLLALGASLQEVAAAVGISVGTARVHLHNIFTKTGTHRQANLVQRIHAGPAGIALMKTR